MKIINLSVFLSIFLLISCSPTSYLKIDVLTPAEYAFSDTGKITVLNTSYIPSIINIPENLISSIPESEKYIFDTLVTANLFNGLFSVLSESPNQYLQNSGYIEVRSTDTINFLNPLDPSFVTKICTENNSSYIISMEYYGFNRESNESFSEDCGWEKTLSVSHQLVWRTYNKNGDLMSQKVDSDTFYWYSNLCTGIDIPEFTDAVREVFFLAGEKYAKKISPSWATFLRSYYLISASGNDISLDPDQLQLLLSGNKKNLAFKACYNLAVIAESEDRLEDALTWLEKAKSFKTSDKVIAYISRIKSRLEIRPVLDQQTGNTF